MHAGENAQPCIKMQIMTIILETINLTKHYPGKLALDHLNLAVQQGEIFGYLGPNGAGKSTTIRLLLDLIRPTEGQAQILGMDTRRHSVAIKRHVGNLPAEVRLWDHLTGVQVLRYLCGLRPGCDWDYACSLAERLQLDLSTLVSDYSTGNRRKLGLIQALMHRPALLILDEPTTGLDPLVQQTFYDLMREIRNEGRTVFLSSHVLSEVETICDRVGILRVEREDLHARVAREGRAEAVDVHAKDARLVGKVLAPQHQAAALLHADFEHGRRATQRWKQVVVDGEVVVSARLVGGQREALPATTRVRPAHR